MGPEGEGIGYDQFRDGVWENADLDFEQICEKLVIGQRCTACLLNVENAFYEFYKTRPENYQQSSARKNQARVAKKYPTLKQALYGVVNAILPERPLTRLHIAPVIAAAQLRTVLTLSNGYPSTIGPTSAAYRYRVVVRDALGVTVEEQSLDLAPGESRDVEVTAGIEANRGSAEIVTGSCWVYQDPLSRGTLGGTRPHLKLVGKNGVSSVHAQVINFKDRTQVLSRANAEERHFVHITNPYRSPLKAEFNFQPLDGGEAVKAVNIEVGARGSEITELPKISGQSSDSESLYMTRLSSTNHRRSHILIADRDLTMMSADHF